MNNLVAGLNQLAAQVLVHYQHAANASILTADTVRSTNCANLLSPMRDSRSFRKPSRERVCGLALVVEFQRRLVDIFMGADVKASGRRRSPRLIASGSGRMPPKIASSASMFWEASDPSKP